MLFIAFWLHALDKVPELVIRSTFGIAYLENSGKASKKSRIFKSVNPLQSY